MIGTHKVTKNISINLLIFNKLHYLIALFFIQFKTASKNTAETTISHEFKHAYDFNQGLQKGLIPWSGDGVDPKEISAVNFENRIRARLRLPLRKKYSTKEIPSHLLENPWKESL